MENTIKKLLKLSRETRKKEDQINKLFGGDFSIDPNMDMENIILDLLQFPKERAGGDLTLSSIEALNLQSLDSSKKYYGFCRDFYLGLINNEELDIEKTYNELIKEKNAIKI